MKEHHMRRFNKKRYIPITSTTSKYYADEEKKKIKRNGGSARVLTIKHKGSRPVYIVYQRI